MLDMDNRLLLLQILLAVHLNNVFVEANGLGDLAKILSALGGEGGNGCVFKCPRGKINRNSDLIPPYLILALS